MKTVLFVNHKELRCGVHEAGIGIYKIISRSTKYKVEYAEIENESEFRQKFESTKPDIIFYNHHHLTIGWIPNSLIEEFNKTSKSIATQHDGFHNPDGKSFNYYLYADAALDVPKEWNNVFVIGRPLREYFGEYPVNSLPTIGSFGFGFPRKRYELIAKTVNDEFDEAIINFQMPYAKYGDNDGGYSRKYAELSRRAITKPGIKLNISHEYISEDALLKFLAGNDINVFLYEDAPESGSASTIDWALAVKRPLAVSKTHMFAHLKTEPSIYLEDSNLRTIMNNGIAPLEKFYKLWSVEGNIKYYDHIFDVMLNV